MLSTALVDIVFVLWLLAMGLLMTWTIWQNIAQPSFDKLHQFFFWAYLPAAFFSSLMLLLAPQNKLAWLLSSLILWLSFIIQKFSLRFLLGDSNQARALFYLGVTACAAALTWHQTDFRPFLLAWACALFGLRQLIGIVQAWHTAKLAQKQAQWVFGAAWLALALLAVLQYSITQQWQIAQIQFAQWPIAAQHCAAALLLLAVVLPAAQWPAQRWLMQSMVAPTPVSAMMHAGLVNAGGVLLVYFGDVLQHVLWAQVLLLIIACFSIVVGCGMALVQVDVKRQLAASTVAQMACMLLQCVLGAYVAALMHLVLHGILKANLFLHAGSALGAGKTCQPETQSANWWLAGSVGIMIIAIKLYLAAEIDAGQIFSAVLLAAVFAHAAHGLQLPVWRFVSLLWLAVIAAVFTLTQLIFNALLEAAVPSVSAPPLLYLLFAMAFLVISSIGLAWLRKRPQHPLSRRIYWFLIAASEPSVAMVNSHPNTRGQLAQPFFKRESKV